MKKRLTRLLAICVCLIIVLSACASTDVDAPSGESIATEESKETSALELSEVNAESTSSEAEPSDEESSESEPSAPEDHISADSDATLSEDITITPVEPTYPEERETTLEKLATFETGKEGLFEYGFVYAEDPSDPTIELPFICAVDQNGNVYADTKAGVVCLNDGANLYDSPSIGMLPVLDMIVCGGDLFVKDDHGDYHRFSLEKGLENASLVKTYHNEENTDIIFGSFVDVGKDEPIISYDGTFYSLDGKQLSDSQVPYVYSEEDADMTISKVRGQSFVLDRYNGLIPYVYSAFDGIAYSFSKRFDTQNGAVYETICFCYDAQGALQSQFMIAKGTGGNVECEIAYGDYMLRSYQGQWISVGKTVFEGVLNSRIEAGKNGEFYLIVYYANYGEVYKINPGYSDTAFSALAEIDGLETENSLAATSGVSATSITVTYVPVSREEAMQKANTIMSTPWTLVTAHKTERENTELPTYLGKNDALQQQTGIPYCWGGFNDREEFIALSETILSGTYTRYMTGNTKCSGYHKPGTIGLDCSGFVGLATGVRMDDGSKPNTTRFTAFGHSVSLNQLELWDVIVSGGDHVMFYAGGYTGTSNIPAQNEYYVYDVSSTTNIEKTRMRVVNEEMYGVGNDYEFYHVYSEYGHNANQHWIQCASCQGYKTGYEPHTFGNYVSTNSSSHVRTCTVCGYEDDRAHTLSYVTNAMTHRQTCSVCGYLSPTEPHNFRYSYDTTKHWRKCRLCDYTTTKTLHTFDADGDCTVCPYSKGLIIMKDPDLPQDAPEVPTDDFIVLCAEPKEEFWESVQR